MNTNMETFVENPKKYPANDFMSLDVNMNLTDSFEVSRNNMILDLFKFAGGHYNVMLDHSRSIVYKELDKMCLTKTLPGHSIPSIVKRHIVDAAYAFLDERFAAQHPIKLMNVTECLSRYYYNFFANTPALSGNITHETRNPRHPEFDVLKHSTELSSLINIDYISVKVWKLMNIAVYSFYRYISMLVMSNLNDYEYKKNLLQQYAKFEREHKAALDAKLKLDNFEMLEDSLSTDAI